MSSHFQPKDILDAAVAIYSGTQPKQFNAAEFQRVFDAIQQIANKGNVGGPESNDEPARKPKPTPKKKVKKRGNRVTYPPT